MYAQSGPFDVGAAVSFVSAEPVLSSARQYRLYRPDRSYRLQQYRPDRIGAGLIKRFQLATKRSMGRRFGVVRWCGACPTWERDEALGSSKMRHARVCIALARVSGKQSEEARGFKRRVVTGLSTNC